MDASNQQRWVGVAILVGVLYVVIGFASAAMANRPAPASNQFAWRLSAFVGSAVLLVAHIWHERNRLHSPARLTAWHTAVGAALGGFGFALVANIHELAFATGYRPRMLVAFVAWPVLTGLPAFVAALILAAVLGRMRVSASRG